MFFSVITKDLTLMMICRGHIHPNLGLFDQVEVTWPIHPLFRSEEAGNPAPQGPGSRLRNGEKAGG